MGGVVSDNGTTVAAGKEVRVVRDDWTTVVAGYKAEVLEQLLQFGWHCCWLATA